MNSCCGHSYLNFIKDKNEVEEVLLSNKKLNYYGNGFNSNIVKLYSAYLGKVSVNLLSDLTNNNFLLEHTVTLGNEKLLIKVINSKLNNLNTNPLNCVKQFYK